MKRNFKNIIETILGYGLVTLTIFIIMYFISIVSSRLLHSLGVKYNSISSLILYFIIVTVVSFPIDTLNRVCLKVLMPLEKINLNIKKALFIVLDTIGIAIVMAIIDYFMLSISVTDLVILIISFTMAICSLNRD